MIQFNLLPDIKQEYIKAQRTRALITSAAVLVSLVGVGLLVLSFVGTDVVQKQRLNSVNNDIKKNSAALQAIPNLNKILTVQNQLGSLSALHSKKPGANRLFDYLNQITPNQADINDLTLDFTQHTVSVTGTADSLSTVNKFVDTIKYTTYTSDKNSSSQSAFSSVVLSSFGRSGGKAQYTITFNYDPSIFDIAQNVKLSVPSLVPTRMGVVSPNALFQGNPAASSSNNGGGGQ